MRRDVARGERVRPSVRRCLSSGGRASIEQVENRILFTGLEAIGQYVSPGLQQLVFTDIASGSNNGPSATAAQTVTLRNTGGSSIAVTNVAIVDDPTLAGDHAGEFEPDGFPTVPTNLGPGQA